MFSRWHAILLLLLAVWPIGCNREPTGGSVAGPPTDEDVTNLRAKWQTPPRPPAASDTISADWGVKATVAEVLAQMGEVAVPALIEALRDPDTMVRVQAARSLARMGPTGSDAVPALIEALHDPDDLVREHAARALGQMGPAASEAIPHLIELLKQPSPDAAGPPPEPQDPTTG